MRAPTRCRSAFRCRANRDKRPRACASSTLSVVPPAASDEGAPAVAGADPDSVAASLGSGLNFDLILSLALFINLPGRQPGLFVLDIASATGSREQIRVHVRRSCALESAARDHVGESNHANSSVFCQAFCAATSIDHLIITWAMVDPATPRARFVCILCSSRGGVWFGVVSHEDQQCVGDIVSHGTCRWSSKSCCTP